MKTNLFSSDAGLDEVVFENRNKMYGAYDLRKTYEDRLTLSAMAAVSFFMLVLSSFVIFQAKPQMPDIEIVPAGGNGTIELTDPSVIIPPAPRMFPEPSASAEVTPEVVKEPVRQAEQPKPNKEFTGTQSTGQGSENGIPGGTGTSEGEGTLPEVLPLPEPKPEVIDFTPYFDVSPVFPNYEGYLQKHIKYPEFAISNNIQGTIYVMVKISATGQIVGTELIKGIGGGCDEEALRVIKSMPAWQPGQMNGKPVSVKCVLRVKMLLQH